MSKHIEHGFIPQSISHISKISNNPQDFVQEIRELNNHIQGKNIISEVLKKKQISLFYSDSRNFQIINNQSIKQQPNQQSQQKNEQDFNHQQNLQKQKQIMQQHQIQQKKLLQKLSGIVQNHDKNQIYEQLKQQEYLKKSQRLVQNLNNYDQRQTQNLIKLRQEQFDHRFQYKRDQNSTDIETEGLNQRQLKIMKHKQQSNIQYLMTQIKQILAYNRHFLLQIQKFQTRRKIAETEIEVRKLKIGMRNHAFTKTINYTSPIKKHNDVLIVKSPKKSNPKLMEQYQYLFEKLQQIKHKNIQFDQKQQILNQYYQHLKSKNNNTHMLQSNQPSSVKLNISRSDSKLKNIHFDKSLVNKEHDKNTFTSLKTINQKLNMNKMGKFIQDVSELGQKAVLILKKQALKDSLFDYKHFFTNKQERLTSENNILKKQIQIINSQISNHQVSQHIWKDRIKYQNQIKKIKNQKSQQKKRFQLISYPKNNDFMNQLRISKSPKKNNFNFTFKAADFCQISQNKSPLKNKLSVRQLRKNIKLSRQNLNTTRNSLSIKLKKSKSQKIIFQIQNNLVQNSSKKGTIKTQQSLDRNSISISAQNEYYNNQFL